MPGDFTDFQTRPVQDDRHNLPRVRVTATHAASGRKAWAEMWVGQKTDVLAKANARFARLLEYEAGR